MRQLSFLASAQDLECCCTRAHLENGGRRPGTRQCFIFGATIALHGSLASVGLKRKWPIGRPPFRPSLHLGSSVRRA